MMYAERSRDWYEPDYQPDPNRTCPICKKDCETIFLFEGDELGCDECLSTLTPLEYEQYDGHDPEFEWYICPECGQECDTIYKDKLTGAVVGCNKCLDEVDSGEWNAEHEE